MAIDRAQVRHVARLARLALGEDEEERVAAQLGKILEYVERLAQVDVSSVEPLSFAADAGDATPLRDDVPRPGVAHERALQGAPVHDGQSFLVPRVVE